MFICCRSWINLWEAFSASKPWTPGTNEAKAALELLKTVVLEGRLISGDAMFCQREICQQIVDSGGDYLFIVKDNQPELKAAIEAEFQPGFSPRYREAATGIAL